MRLTRSFLSSEFACQCAMQEKTGADYCGGQDWIDIELVEGLQVLRNIINAERSKSHLSEVGITITSGCRCERHNADIPDASQNSQHLFGRAADIVVPGYKPEKLLKICLRHRLFTGLGIYPDKNILHVDIRDGIYGNVVVW